MLLTLLGQTSATFRHRIGFLIRWMSRGMAGHPRQLIVLPSARAEAEEEFQQRLIHYLGGEHDIQVACRRGTRWFDYRVSGTALHDIRPMSWLSLCWRVVTGRILLGRATRWTHRLDGLFPGKFFLVDWLGHYRYSAWRWASSGTVVDPGRVFGIWKQASPLANDEVILLGTGPSAEMVYSEPFRHLPVIVCNTVVKSARLRPRIAAICISDPLYFLAPTAYTAAFQAALRESLEAHPFPVVIDAEHADYYRRRCPWIPEGLLMPVIMSHHFRANADFRAAPVTGYQNSVFTRLMLPFAATYCRRIYLIGFDGKDPKAGNYFWKHSEEFQFQDLLPTVKAHDHGFFAGNDPEFYVRHNEAYSRELEEMLPTVEARGVEVIMTHPSFVPALARQYDKSLASKRPISGEPSRTVASAG